MSAQLEHRYRIDVLGKNWEQYNMHAERFVVDWDDTMKDTGKDPSRPTAKYSSVSASMKKKPATMPS